MLQLLEVRSTVHTLNEEKVEAEEALAEALALCEEQEDDLASLRANSTHELHREREAQRVREESRVYLTRMGKRMTVIEADVYPPETLCATRLEATPVFT
jgi:urease accessory protein UreF